MVDVLANKSLTRTGCLRPFDLPTRATVYRQQSDCRAANRSLGLRVEWFDAGQRFAAGRLGPDPPAVPVYRW